MLDSRRSKSIGKNCICIPKSNFWHNIKNQSDNPTARQPPLFQHPPAMADSSTYSDLRIDDTAEWEIGLRTIETLLEPGSVSVNGNALLPWQQEGLKTMHKMLCSTGREDPRRNHIPKNMLSECEENGDSSSFLEQYGIKKRSTTRIKLKSVVNANRFIRALRTATSTTESASFEPPEWSQLSSESRDNLQELLSWSSLSRWDFNVFELQKHSNGNPLLFLGWAVMGSPTAQKVMARSCGKEINTLASEGYNFTTLFNFKGATLCNYLRTIEGDYRAINPYHNNTHAADVVQTLHVLIQKGGKEFASDIELFSIILASVAHDVGHPGFNNAFQVNASTPLALRYNDISVLENMHASRAFLWLFGGAKENQNMDILGGMNSNQITLVRKLAIDAILDTDMNKHFEKMEQMKALLKSKSVDSIKKDDCVLLLNVMLHLADISNPAKIAPMFTSWTERCLEEYFLQGDKEAGNGLPISPLCDRFNTDVPQTQIGFIQYVITPAYEILGNFLPFVKSDVLPIITQNLEYWQKEKHLKDSDRKG